LGSVYALLPYGEDVVNYVLSVVSAGAVIFVAVYIAWVYDRVSDLRQRDGELNNNEILFVCGLFVTLFVEMFGFSAASVYFWRML
jgi:hypothetical protein